MAEMKTNKKTGRTSGKTLKWRKVARSEKSSAVYHVEIKIDEDIPDTAMSVIPRYNDIALIWVEITTKIKENCVKLLDVSDGKTIYNYYAVLNYERHDAFIVVYKSKNQYFIDMREVGKNQTLNTNNWFFTELMTPIWYLFDIRMGFYNRQIISYEELVRTYQINNLRVQNKPTDENVEKSINIIIGEFKKDTTYNYASCDTIALLNNRYTFQRMNDALVENISVIFERVLSTENYNEMMSLLFMLSRMDIPDRKYEVYMRRVQLRFVFEKHNIQSFVNCNLCIEKFAEHNCDPIIDICKSFKFGTPLICITA